MSHSVTVTRTTTTTQGSAMVINVGYVKTWPCLLKLVQLILGAVNVGLVSYYYDRDIRHQISAEIFFLLIAVTFLIGTFILLLSCLISLSSATLISKTIYEVIYHGVAFILYLIASLTFIVEVNRWKHYYHDDQYKAYLAASIIGLFVSVLYLLSTIFAQKAYKST